MLKFGENLKDVIITSGQPMILIKADSFKNVTTVWDKLESAKVYEPCGPTHNMAMTTESEVPEEKTNYVSSDDLFTGYMILGNIRKSFCWPARSCWNVWKINETCLTAWNWSPPWCTLIAHSLLILNSAALRKETISSGDEFFLSPRGI